MLVGYGDEQNCAKMNCNLLSLRRRRLGNASFVHVHVGAVTPISLKEDAVQELLANAAVGGFFESVEDKFVVGRAGARWRSVFQRQFDGFDPLPLGFARLGVERVGVMIVDFRENELMRPLVDADAAIPILDAVFGQIQGVLVPKVLVFGLTNEQHLVEEKDVTLTRHSILVSFDRHLTVFLKFPVISEGRVL